MSKKEVIYFFNKIASDWDKREKKQTYLKLNKIINKIKLIRYNNVLDVGCGTGICYPYLSKKFKNYSGIDISNEMIKVAQNKFKNANFINADFDKYRFEKNFFDLVIIFNSFPHFEDREKTIKKAKSILKENGKLVIAHSFKLRKINQIHKKTNNKTIKKHTITQKEIETILKKIKFKNIKIINKNYFYIEATK